jgi:hypothetical protein
VPISLIHCQTLSTLVTYFWITHTSVHGCRGRSCKAFKEPRNRFPAGGIDKKFKDLGFVFCLSFFTRRGGERGNMREQYTHKVLTYLEYRAVSGVFQNIGNIDPPPPLSTQRVCPPPATPTPRAVRGWGSTSSISWPLTV